MGKKKDKEPITPDYTVYIEVWDYDRKPHRYKIDKDGEFTIRGGTNTETKSEE